jgi:hypothetical protein
VTIDLANPEISMTGIGALGNLSQEGRSVRWGLYKTFEIDNSSKKVILKYVDDEQTFFGEGPCGETFYAPQ